MIALGPCSECGAPLAADQRYCVNCGNRVASYVPIRAATPAIEKGPAKKPLLPLPPQMASTFAAAALGFGVVVGTAISPNLSGIIASAPEVVQLPSTATPVTPPPTISVGGGGGGSNGPVQVAGGSTSPTPASSKTPSGSHKKHHKKKHHKKKPALPQTILSGTVVHLNPAAGSYTIAPAGGGALLAIHAAQLPQPGTSVTSVPVTQLFNGTYAEAGNRVASGSAGSATFSGTVTYRDTSTGVYSVSSRGSSVLVHQPPVTPPATVPAPPALGAVVNLTVTITPTPAGTAPSSTTPPPNPSNCSPSTSAPPVVPAATLTQTAVNVVSQATGPTDLEGSVQATCAPPAPGSPKQLVVSADDVGESGKTLLLNVPDAIDFTRLQGSEVLDVRATLVDPPPYTLVGLLSDTGAAGANDSTTAQGQP